MSDRALPKVLIIGQNFTSTTGGGITLSNLFKDWPKEKLALVAESKEALDFTKCSNYYRMGYAEMKMPFPFNLFQRRTQGGLLTEAITIGAVEIKKTIGWKKRLKGIVDEMLNYSGLYFLAYGQERLSRELLAWIKEFDPDVVYFQPGSYKQFNFIQHLKENMGAPLVSHVMDDWFSFAVKPGPLYHYWNRKLQKKILDLFSITQLHLSISDLMATEFESRYGHKFYAYHNPIDMAFWGAYAKKDIHDRSSFEILYAGRVGYGIDKTLQKVSDAVEQLGQTRQDVTLEIQTADQDHPMFKRFSKYKFVRVTKPIDYAALPGKFADADALLIPYDFEGSGLKYIKYSMPTKVSEYMASGTPVLVVGPEDTALLRYAQQGWASVCTKSDIASISEAILKLKNSIQLRKSISAKAKEFAFSNHDQRVTVNRFRNQILAILKKPIVNLSV